MTVSSTRADRGIPVVRPAATWSLWSLWRTDDPPDPGVCTISDPVDMQFYSPRCHRKRDRSPTFQSRRETQMNHRGAGPGRRDVVRHPLGDEDEFACLDAHAVGVRP